jgi:hypothetical protein
MAPESGTALEGLKTGRYGIIVCVAVTYHKGAAIQNQQKSSQFSDLVLGAFTDCNDDCYVLQVVQDGYHSSESG